jgi:hypothetical protein
MFSIVCLAQNASSDWMARRFRALSREWHDVDALNDAALAARARELGIDILIDLGGYGDAGRMAACAHRMAPVQIKWVGMQNHSSGLPEMDWIMTDRWETPPELEQFYSERPLRLADGYVCYSPPPYAPDVGSLPALRNDHVTFGCFNNLAKITPAVIATWSAILHRVPNARLILKAHQFADAPTADRYLAEFAAHGVSPERIEFRGPSKHRAFIGEYNDIDIVLDPFPYTGGLTTCEALWMGVPTVTVPGETFSSRHSMSHLSNAGLADWVAPNLPAYIKLAAAKVLDVDALASLRSRLRAQVRASPLCDTPRFGRNLGAALRFAWREWCTDREAPSARPRTHHMDEPDPDCSSAAATDDHLAPPAVSGPTHRQAPASLLIRQPSIGAPHLFDGELEVMRRLMHSGHRRYQEFGIGGSTLMAIRSELESIVAVDSDPNWLEAACRHEEIASAVGTGRTAIRYADIGPVAKWGYPRDRGHIQNWPAYLATAWETWVERDEVPDLILVDGRFRVGCCLSAILLCEPASGWSREMRVMLHDVGPERPYYDAVFEFFDIVEAVNTLRVMKVKPGVSRSRVMSRLLRHQFDPR